jgi:hypothetical protein
MWLSADSAMGEYIPRAPVDDDARKYNQNLPGMGGVFNYVNLHTYHYAGNNPVKYVDPTGAIIRIGFERPFNQAVRVTLNFTSIGKEIKNSYESIFSNKFNINLYIFEDKSLANTDRLGSTAVIYNSAGTKITDIGIKIKPGQSYWEIVLVTAHEMGHVKLADNSIAYINAGELSAFEAQFSAASELYATSPKESRERWNTALRNTLPRELQSAYNEFDISKSYSEQNDEFKMALRDGATSYQNNLEKSGVY